MLNLRTPFFLLVFDLVQAGSKIVRVLNLWLKNDVFDMEILRPLMDMANGTVVPPPALEAVPVDPQPETTPPVSNASAVPVVPQLPTPEALAAVAQLFQTPHAQELQRMIQNFQQADKTVGAPTIGSNITNQPQMSITQLNPCSAETVKKGSLAEVLILLLVSSFLKM
ncbi:hypothetical protein GOODEAATRI_020855 [Goodea atripinnis]|uniref:CID domain-containing protein n=1 Tax=Goodea atripinnis TaxID=208336 RepID=A0ABV0NZ11_9TELE